MADTNRRKAAILNGVLRIVGESATVFNDPPVLGAASTLTQAYSLLSAGGRRRPPTVRPWLRRGEGRARPPVASIVGEGPDGQHRGVDKRRSVRSPTGVPARGVVGHRLLAVTAMAGRTARERMPPARARTG
ncbi:MAG: hypothetical protein LBV60_21705, partial [Streptomyces sp.]|nr:hypothetical protein [Streptomyces sp.]